MPMLRPTTIAFAVEVERLRDRGHEPLGEGGGAFWLAQARLHDREFVAAEPRDGVGLPHRGREPRRHLLEQPIAGAMAAQVVDVLEAIEVEAQHRDLLVRPPRPRQLLLEPVAEQDPVRQLGQRVVGRHEADLRLGACALGDVADRRHAHAPALVVHRPAQDLDRDVAAVGVQDVDLVGLLGGGRDARRACSRCSGTTKVSTSRPIISATL